MSSARERLKAANSANQQARISEETKESKNLIDEIVQENEKSVDQTKKADTTVKIPETSNEKVKNLFKKEKQLKSYHKNYLVTEKAKENIEKLAKQTGKTENAIVNELFENLFEILEIDND